MRPDDPSPLCDGPAGLSGVRLRSRGASGVMLACDARLDDRARLGRELGVSERETTSAEDCELILRAYERWGEGCASRLVGAFAFAVWDSRRGLLFAARDHMGFRPLHYYFDRDVGLVAASWAEGVLAHPAVPRRPDPSAVAAQAANAADQLRERSLFDGVRKLLPGGALVARPGELPRLSRHWTPGPRAEFGTERAEDCVVALRAAIRVAVADAVCGNELTGAHLSGGVDSSTVAVLADQELRRLGGQLARGYSWAPPSGELALLDEDERPRAQSVAAAIGVPLTFVASSPDDLARVDALREALQPTMMQLHEGRVLRDASERGLRVLLTGWGGDEVVSFNGRGWISGLLRAGLPREAVRDAWRMAVGHGARGPRRLTGTAGFLWREGAVPLLPDRVWVGLGFARRQGRRVGVEPHDRAQRAARRVSALNGRERPGVHACQVALIERGHLTARIESWAWTGDRVGIAYRYPLLDRRVLDLCLALPERLWWHEGERRWLFRRVADGILPEGVPSSSVKHEPAIVESMRALRERSDTQGAS